MTKSGVFGLGAVAVLLIVSGSSAVPVVGAKIHFPFHASGSSVSSSPSISYKTEGHLVPLCTARASVEALSKKEFQDSLLTVFLDLSNRSGHLQTQTTEYFAAEMAVPNECATIATGLNPPLSYYPLTERPPLNQLVEYYFNLTRFALATGDALVWEEQREVRLQSSFYKELVAIKALLHQGAVNIRKVLVNEGYECVTDPFPAANVVLQTVDCPRRYVALVTIMNQLNTESSQALSLLYKHWETMQG